jgi:hypothetical protein
MEKEFQVTFKGFKTAEQAKIFAEWYSGSGEQEVGLWLEEHSDIDSAYTKEIKLKENGNVIITLKI